MFKIATVCSGIGSPEQYLKDQEIPHEISFACEIDKYARQTYLANFEPNAMYTDMTKEDWNLPEQYSDIFIGGIPCQAFSLAGKRLGELDPRGLLFYDFYRYVKNQQPKIFIIENVKGLLSDNNGSTFNNWVQLLGRSMNTHLNMFNHEDSLLYNLHFKVLNSKDFGVPQNRERVFLVGIRNDLPNTFRFPPGFRLTKRLKDILEPVVDEKYYLSEAAIERVVYNREYSQVRINPEITGTINTKNNSAQLSTDSGTTLITEAIFKIGQASTENSQGGAVYDTKGLSPTICAGTHGYALGYIQEPKAGRITGRNPENPKSRVSGLHTEQMLEINEESYITNTLTTVAKDNVIFELDRKHERIRRLTPLECMRLQGFPDSYIKPCSDSQTYKQAGNSITTFTIGAIIDNLLPILQDAKSKLSA